METDMMHQVAIELNNRGYDAQIFTVPKNNVALEALTVRMEGSSISPTIYPSVLADLYQPWMDAKDLATEVLRFTDSHIRQAPSFPLQLDRDYLLSNARLSICREDWNQPLLERTPYRRVEGTDLAVYPKILLGEGTIRPTNSLLSSFGIREEELLEAAEKNSLKDYSIQSMSSVLAEMTGTKPEEIPLAGMVVISSRAGRDGASAITDPETLERAREMLGTERIFLIPSSVHELIAVPEDTIGSEQLAGLIQDVNEETVLETERLSDHPYVYDGKSLSMTQNQEHEITRASERSRIR